MARSTIEFIAAGLFAVAAALTLVVPDWIEAVFRVDPDGGSGSLEWLIVVLLGVLAVAAGWLGRRDRALGR